MNNVEFVLLNSNLPEEWQQYVNNTKGTTFIHSPAWKDIVVDSYGHKPYYIIAFNEKKIVGVLPLFLISIPLIGRILASGIYASYGGLCADNIEVASALFKHASLIAESLNTKYLEIKNSYNFNINFNKWEKYLSYCTMFINLDKSSDTLWKNLTGKVRQNVRKALDSGVKVVNGKEYLDQFYYLVALNMRLLGTPVHSKKFYQLILEKFKGEADIFVANISGKPVAAKLVIKFKDTIYDLTNVADYNYLNYKPNVLVFWEVIKSVEGSNIEFFDLGRSIAGSGSFNFKKSLGAYLVPLYYDYYLNTIKKVPSINQGNKLLKPAIFVWQHIPLNLTKFIGPHLIKYVA